MTIGSPTYILAGCLLYGPGKSFGITLQIKSYDINYFSSKLTGIDPFLSSFLFLWPRTELK